jgi:hypothetical protein
MPHFLVSYKASDFQGTVVDPIGEYTLQEGLDIATKPIAER